MDILIPSREFALELTGAQTIQDAMRILNEKYSPEILVVTDGSNGGYYLQDDNIINYESVKVKAIDTNGAGDTFHGAFITAYCRGYSLKECCDFASKIAAVKCTQKGVRNCNFTC